MKKRQLGALGICTIAIYAAIGGLVGLLPVYLRRLGADESIIGLFLASAYLALALSNVVAGWLAEHFRRRKVFLIVGGAMATPLVWLMSRATTVGALWALMAALWFVIGIPMTMSSILIGLGAVATSRGRSFGLLSLGSGLGLFLGNAISGPVVDRRGFPALFAVFSLIFLLIPLAGCFVHEHVVPRSEQHAAPGLHGVFSTRLFTVLFVASILAQAANIMIFLSRPLIMDSRHFDATMISRANAVGNLLTLPLPLVLGWLADRAGRKWIIVVCFLAPTLGLLTQTAASEPWHFWISR